MNRRRTFAGLTAFMLMTCLPLSRNMFADGPARRPEWDQKKAWEMVTEIFAIKDKGDLPWDDFVWRTKIDKAVTQAEKKAKPLLVYIYLKKECATSFGPLLTGRKLDEGGRPRQQRGAKQNCRVIHSVESGRDVG